MYIYKQLIRNTTNIPKFLFIYLCSKYISTYIHRYICIYMSNIYVKFPVFYYYAIYCTCLLIIMYT